LKLRKSGSFAGQSIRHVSVIGIERPPKEMRADGREIKFDFDATNKQLKADIPDNVSEIVLDR
jgi:hypothetical protein